MNIFEPHSEILPASQQYVWPLLAPLQKMGFVLYGGTAVALRLGHRQSVDFDFFSDQTLDKSALYKILPILATATVIQDAPDSLTVLVPVDVSAVTEYVKLSFFGNINNGRVGEPDATPDGIMVVASLADMMAHKLKVVLQRILRLRIIVILLLCSNMVWLLMKVWRVPLRYLVKHSNRARA